MAKITMENVFYNLILVHKCFKTLMASSLIVTTEPANRTDLQLTKYKGLKER